jgi:hypothetical protein
LDQLEDGGVDVSPILIGRTKVGAADEFGISEARDVNQRFTPDLRIGRLRGWLGWHRVNALINPEAAAANVIGAESARIEVRILHVHCDRHCRENRQSIRCLQRNHNNRKAGFISQEIYFGTVRV